MLVFPFAELNLVENYLKEDRNRIVVFSMDEAGNQHETSRSELRFKVIRIASVLRDAGVKPGDRIAGILTNDSKALAALLATFNFEAIWTSGSQDFGQEAIIDRIGRGDPCVLFAKAKYRYELWRHDAISHLGYDVQKIDSVERLAVNEVTLGFSF